MNALLLRDFDAEVMASQAPASSENSEVPSFTFTEEELHKLMAEARAEGHQNGLAEGEAIGRKAETESIEAAAVGALQEIHQQLEAFTTQDQLRRADMQQDIIELFLEVAERIAPEFLKAYSTDMVQNAIKNALHLGNASSKLTVTLSTETFAAIAEPLKSLPSAGETLEITADPSFTNAQAHASWDNGFLDYNLDTVVQELLTILRIAAKPETPLTETEKV